jgi:hypothetical protein
MYKSYNASEKDIFELLSYKMKGGEFMGFVRIPEMMTPELAKALAGNIYTVKNEPDHKEEVTASWKEYHKSDKKHSNKKEKECAPQKHSNDVDICCPNKVKFIFILNNTAVINVNAISEENHCSG